MGDPCQLTITQKAGLPNNKTKQAYLATKPCNKA